MNEKLNAIILYAKLSFVKTPTTVKLTRFIVTKSDGGESDQSIIDALSNRPFFQHTKYKCWNEGEEAEKDG